MVNCRGLRVTCCRENIDCMINRILYNSESRREWKTKNIYDYSVLAYTCMSLHPLIFPSPNSWYTFYINTHSTDSCMALPYIKPIRNRGKEQQRRSRKINVNLEPGSLPISRHCEILFLSNSSTLFTLSLKVDYLKICFFENHYNPPMSTLFRENIWKVKSALNHFMVKWKI